MTKTTTPKKIGAAVDDECSQDDEKDNCGDEGPPVIFGAPWIGPSAIVVRATSAFKVWLYHIRFLLSYRQNVFSLCRVPIPMRVCPAAGGALAISIPSTPRLTIIDVRAGNIPVSALAIGLKSEAEHFIKCPACGGRIDCRDLGQVIEHFGSLPHPAQDKPQ